MSRSLARVQAVLALTLCVFTSAQAALIDDGVYTTDTNSGLIWLDLSETFSLSYAEVHTATMAGGQYDNHRVATRPELETLLGDYFGSTDLWYFWGQSASPLTGAYFDDPGVDELADGLVNNGVVYSNGTSTMNGGQWSIHETGQGISTALVQVQSVPLPAPAYLLVTALLGLAGVSRRG